MARRAGRTPDLQPLRLGLGLGPAIPRSGCGSATPGWGGTRTPLVVHWPAGIAAEGEVRSQFCHAVDLAPTVLELCGVDTPESVDGVAQMPIHGSSLAATFDNPDSPSPRSEQYFEVQGSRAMYLDGWKATTDHVGQAHGDEIALMEGSRSFADDTWALFCLDEDFSEAVKTWPPSTPRSWPSSKRPGGQAAERYHVLPLDDGYAGRMPAIYPPGLPASRPSPVSARRETGGRRGVARAGAGVHHRRRSGGGPGRRRGHRVGHGRLDQRTGALRAGRRPGAGPVPVGRSTTGCPPRRFPPTPPAWGAATSRPRRPLAS